MRNTPPHSHRLHQEKQRKLQPGTLLSFTTVHHPPAGFATGSRVIGLIELADGSKATGQLLVSNEARLTIGQAVTPRLRLQSVNEAGLRHYDVAYEVAVKKPVPQFPGYILALTGPSGVGKTTVSVLLATQVGAYAKRVPIVTTRPPKNGDEDEYEHVSHDEFLALKKAGSIVASTEISSRSEQRLYGYRHEDIEAIWHEGKTPIVITEMHLLQDLATHYGRRSILSCGLLPPGSSRRQMISSLLHRLRIRGRDTEEQINDRLKNAEADLQFFTDRSELFDHMIVNDNLEAVIADLTKHVDGTLKRA